VHNPGLSRSFAAENKIKSGHDDDMAYSGAGRSHRRVPAFFGVFAFDRFVAAAISARGITEINNYWQGRIWFFNLILLLLSGIAWFALVAMSMSGQPLQTAILKAVWAQTQFGAVSKIRLIFWWPPPSQSFFIFQNHKLRSKDF
jgi:hypothetical protein